MTKLDKEVTIAVFGSLALPWLLSLAIPALQEPMDTVGFFVFIGLMVLGSSLSLMTISSSRTLQRIVLGPQE